MAKKMNRGLIYNVKKEFEIDTYVDVITLVIYADEISNGVLNVVNGKLVIRPGTELINTCGKNLDLVTCNDRNRCKDRDTCFYCYNLDELISNGTLEEK